MFKNLKIAVKIGVGFTIVLILAAALAMLGNNGIQYVVNSSELLEHVGNALESLTNARKEEKNFLHL